MPSVISPSTDLLGHVWYQTNRQTASLLGGSIAFLGMLWLVESYASNPNTRSKLAFKDRSEPC